MAWIYPQIHRFPSSSFMLISVNSKVFQCGYKFERTSFFFIAINDRFIKRWKQSICLIPPRLRLTMMRLLSGTMVIKDARTRKQRLKKSSCPLPGIPIVWWIGACQKMKRCRGSNRQLFLKIIWYENQRLRACPDLTYPQRA